MSVSKNHKYPKEECIENFLDYSKCANKIEVTCLINLLGGIYRVTKIIYRGSIDGMKRDDFHKNCDNKGPTITLMKIKNGPCIGALSLTNYSSKTEWKNDHEAKLFNLTANKVF